MNNYYTRPEISRSELIRYKRSPYAGINSEPIHDTDAMIFGRAFHAYMEMQGEMFFTKYFVMPDDSLIISEIGGKNPRNTKVYREWKANQEVIANGREVISFDDYNDITKMAANVQATEMYKTLFNGQYPYESEVAKYTRVAGLEMKALGDRVVDRGNDLLIIDWKTTSEELTDNTFQITRIIRKYLLHVQQHHYTEVFKAATGKEVMFCFFFVESKAPYEVLPVIISPNSELLADGAELWQQCVMNYKLAKSGQALTLSDLLTEKILIL
jgi:hypothetical protein